MSCVGHVVVIWSIWNSSVDIWHYILLSWFWSKLKNISDPLFHPSWTIFYKHKNLHHNPASSQARHSSHMYSMKGFDLDQDQHPYHFEKNLAPVPLESPSWSAKYSHDLTLVEFHGASRRSGWLAIDHSWVRSNPKKVAGWHRVASGGAVGGGVQRLVV